MVKNHSKIPRPVRVSKPKIEDQASYTRHSTQYLEKHIEGLLKSEQAPSRVSWKEYQKKYKKDLDELFGGHEQVDLIKYRQELDAERNRKIKEHKKKIEKKEEKKKKKEREKTKNKRKGGEREKRNEIETVVNERERGRERGKGRKIEIEMRIKKENEIVGSDLNVMTDLTKLGTGTKEKKEITGIEIEKEKE